MKIHSLTVERQRIILFDWANCSRKLSVCKKALKKNKEKKSKRRTVYLSLAVVR